MKFNYLFVDRNNGHLTTYHPFTSNTILDQERVTQWLNQVPGAGRMGTSIYDLMYRLVQENIPFDEFKCPCCESLIKQLYLTRESDFRRWKDTWDIEWILIEGVSGNY
jgi:hypothetical protein